MNVMECWDVYDYLICHSILIVNLQIFVQLHQTKLVFLSH